jgi:hypothetical protein
VGYVGCILVEDASGCRFEIHEFRVRRTLFRTTRLALDTGEEVRRVDANTFALPSTGETFVLINETG